MYLKKLGFHSDERRKANFQRCCEKLKKSVTAKGIFFKDKFLLRKHSRSRNLKIHLDYFVEFPLMCVDVSRESKEGAASFL